MSSYGKNEQCSAVLLPNGSIEDKSSSLKYKTSNSLEFIKQAYAATIALQLAVMLGVILGYSAYLLPQWHETESFTISAQTESLIATTNICFRPLGALLDVVAIDKFGRRGTLRIIFLLMAVGWLLTGLAFNLHVFIAGRALNSIFVGMVASASLYVSEISSDNNRATFLACISPLITLGTAITYVLMYFFYWRVTAFIMTVYCLITFGLLFTIPETAYWYVMRGKRSDADRSLKWFCSNENTGSASERLKAIEESEQVDASLATKWKTFRQPVILSRFVFMVLMTNLLQWTGYLVIPNFAVDFFRSLQAGYEEELVTIIFGFGWFFCDVVLIVIVNKFNRKSLIVSCGLVMSITMTVAVMLQAMASRIAVAGWPDILRKLSLFASFLYTCTSHMGFNELIFVIIPELFPTIIRGTAYAMLCFIYFSSMLITFYLYPIIMATFGFIFLGVVFILCCIGVILITAFYIPETRNIPLHKAGAVSSSSPSSPSLKNKPADHITV